MTRTANRRVVVRPGVRETRRRRTTARREGDQEGRATARRERNQEGDWICISRSESETR